MERRAHLDSRGDAIDVTIDDGHEASKRLTLQERDTEAGRVVDVVLSDMCAPWDQLSRTWVKSVSDPYRRMMNTSGISFKDHVGSMVSVGKPVHSKFGL